MNWWQGLLCFMAVGVVALHLFDEKEDVLMAAVGGAVVGAFAFPLFWLWAILAGAGAGIAALILWYFIEAPFLPKL